MSRNIKKIVVIYEKNDKTNEKLIIGFDIYGQIFNVKSSNTLEEYKQNIEDCYKKARDYLKDVYNLDLDREYTKENIKTQEIANLNLQELEGRSEQYFSKKKRVMQGRQTKIDEIVRVYIEEIFSEV